MTVGEIIEKLKQLDASLEIIASYDGGAYEVNDVILNSNWRDVEGNPVTIAELV